MSVSAVTAGAIAQSGGGIASSLINAGANKRSQKRANKFNRESWHMQNAYNSPTAQMQRLREAGLNPNLIYGTSGNTGQASSVAPSKAVRYDSPNPFSDINAFANLKNTSAQTDNLKEQNTVLAQEALLKSAQTGNTSVNTARSKFDLNLSKDLRNTSLQAASANVKNIEANTIGKELDNRFNDQSLKQRVLNIYYNGQNAQATLKGTNLSNELKKLEKELMQMGIQKNDNMFFRVLGRLYNKEKKNISTYLNNSNNFKK